MGLLLCIFVITACKEDAKESDLSPLQLVSVTPSEREQVTTGTVEVTFEFNQPITIKDATKITLNNKVAKNVYAVARFLKTKVEIDLASTNVFKIDMGALSVFPTDRINENVYSTEFTAVDNPGLEFNISSTPCNPNADANVKALYTWMLKQQGKKMISGSTQEQFSWIIQHAGKTPLLKGWDMQPYSPRYAWYSENGAYVFRPDLNNPATPDATAWYNNNGKKPIIAFSWHWHSPMGGEPGTNTFYMAETDFDASKAVIEGTEEYKATIRDIDAIADQLKKLNDAGVPVLWRPLHEAGGTWFWWSAKGPDVYKELWNIMYDRLTNHHHLNNLLWVWNGDDVDWYVGDDKCDIISNDVGQDDIYKSEFEKAYRVTNGTKMLALSETGIVPDVDKALSQGVHWTYWMTWQDAVKNRSDEELTAIFNSLKVVTLESYIE